MKSDETQDTAPNLTGKQAKVLCALVSGRTIENAAKDAGVNASTVHVWLKSAAFAEEYRAARRNVVDHATATLQAACGVAVDTLNDIATDTEAPASSRVTAAKAILDLSIKAVELSDIGERIEALESASKGNI